LPNNSSLALDAVGVGRGPSHCFEGARGAPGGSPGFQIARLPRPHPAALTPAQREVRGNLEICNPENLPTCASPVRPHYRLGPARRLGREGSDFAKGADGCSWKGVRVGGHLDGPDRASGLKHRRFGPPDWRQIGGVPLTLNVVRGVQIHHLSRHRDTILTVRS